MIKNSVDGKVIGYHSGKLIRDQVVNFFIDIHIGTIVTTTTTGNGNFTLRFWGDGQCLKTYSGITKSNQNILFSLDVSGISSLKITSSNSGSYSRGYVYIAYGKAIMQSTFLVPGTALISAKNTKGRKLTVKWLKNIAVNGYVVQMSTNKAFTSGVVQKTVYNNQTISLKSQKLKKKKTYYVRACTYMVINGQIYYSDWSNVKKVKIKK